MCFILQSCLKNPRPGQGIRIYVSSRNARDAFGKSIMFCTKISFCWLLTFIDNSYLHDTFQKKIHLKRTFPCGWRLMLDMHLYWNDIAAHFLAESTHEKIVWALPSANAPCCNKSHKHQRDEGCKAPECHILCYGHTACFWKTGIIGNDSAQGWA